MGVVIAVAGAPALPRPYRLSVSLGLILTLVLGAGIGGVLGSMDDHWIGGVESDADGLPLFGWSRTGGDLRAAHFLGMHAMHVLPLTGALITRLAPAGLALPAVWGAALGYVGLTAAVFLQAWAGRPLIGL